MDFVIITPSGVSDHFVVNSPSAEEASKMVGDIKDCLYIKEIDELGVNPIFVNALIERDTLQSMGVCISIRIVERKFSSTREMYEWISNVEIGDLREEMNRKYSTRTKAEIDLNNNTLILSIL